MDQPAERQKPLGSGVGHLEVGFGGESFALPQTDDEFASGRDAHLSHDALEMVLYRVLADEAFAGHILIRESLGDILHDLDFAFRQMEFHCGFLDIDCMTLNDFLDQNEHARREIGLPLPDQE